MKKITLLLFACIVSICSYSQDIAGGFQFNSKLYRVFYKQAGEDTFRQAAKMEDHTIIFSKDKRLLTYQKTLEFELKILHELPKTTSEKMETYEYNCLDTRTLKECTVKLIFFEEKPFTLNIDFGEIRVEYFLEEK
ncbi:MAG: hypothetical protein ABI402_05980 [Ferruginibacter sp.]